MSKSKAKSHSPVPEGVQRARDEHFWRLNPPRRHLSYEELDAIVQRYKKERDPEAAQALIAAFEGYLMHYQLLLTRGTFNLSRWDIRKFLSFFVSDPLLRKHHNHYRRMPKVQSALLRSAVAIKESLMSAYDPQDIWHELCAILLTMALRYESNDDAPRFHNYVDKAFCVYAASEFRRRIGGDPLVFHRSALKTVTKEVTRYGEVIRDALTETPAPEYPVDQMRGNLDARWIAGEGVHPYFADLSPLERELLVAYHIEKERVRQTAARLGISPQEASRLRRQAEQKVRSKARAQDPDPATALREAQDATRVEVSSSRKAVPSTALRSRSVRERSESASPAS